VPSFTVLDYFSSSLPVVDRPQTMSVFSPKASSQDGPGPLEELWLRLRAHAHWFPYISEEVHSVVESLRSATYPETIPARP
jgi:hypothetical protein